MTRNQLLRTVRWALKRNQGADLEVQAQGVADAIELALDMDQVDAESTVVEFPMSDTKSRSGHGTDLIDAIKANPGKGEYLPPSPAVTAKKEPTVITPDSREAKEVLGERPVSPIPRARVDAPPASKPEFCWALHDLLSLLHAKTPETLKIEVSVEGRGIVPITLERNVIAGIGSVGDAKEVPVKLSYKAPQVGDDLAASETFWTTEPTLDIDGALERILDMAKKLYRPRPRVIVSSTPARHGSLSFDSSTPHEETDILTNDSGRRY